MQIQSLYGKIIHRSGVSFSLLAMFNEDLSSAMDADWRACPRLLIQDTEAIVLKYLPNNQDHP